MQIIKKMLMTLVTGACCLTSVDAQTSDKESLGFFSMAGYPYCKMPNTSETYSLVTNRIVPLGEKQKYIDRSFNFQTSYLQEVSTPDGVDFVVSVDNDYQTVSKLEIFEQKVERPAPRKHSRQSAQKVILEIGSFKLYSSTPEKEKEAARPAPVPNGPKLFIATRTKELGFTVEVIDQHNNQVVFVDTINVLQDFESAPQTTPKLAEEDLNKKMEGLTLESVMKDYNPFLSKVLGTTPTILKLHVYGVKIKKKCTIDYSDLNGAVETFKSAFEFIKKRQFQIDEFKQMAEPSVKIWQEALKQSDLKNKNAKINKEITAAIYYNLAVYYALIKDFDASVDYFKKSDSTEVGFADALNMSKMAQTWQRAEENYKKRMAE